MFDAIPAGLETLFRPRATAPRSLRWHVAAAALLAKLRRRARARRRRLPARRPLQQPQPARARPPRRDRGVLLRPEHVRNNLRLPAARAVLETGSRLPIPRPRRRRASRPRRRPPVPEPRLADGTRRKPDGVDMTTKSPSASRRVPSRASRDAANEKKIGPRKRRLPPRQRRAAAAGEARKRSPAPPATGDLAAMADPPKTG